MSSEITSEAADSVILQSSLLSVDTLIHIGRRMRRIALVGAGGGMLLSAVGMGAAAFGFPASIQGALLQEAIIIVSILNSLRIILPARLSDFAEPRPGMSPGSFEPGDKDEAEHELATPSVGR